MTSTLNIADSEPTVAARSAARREPYCGGALPGYLVETYSWAYLNPRNVRLLDRDFVVNAILWGNMGRLKRSLLEELAPGADVLQAAHVYGSLIPDMAIRIGEQGRLDVIDVSPIQVANCRRKIRNLPQATARLADAATLEPAPYDLVSCFFLLHELPSAYRRTVMDALLACVAPGGKAVFIDYHRPRGLHPLKPVMSLIFDLWEPFAKGLWRREIADIAPRPAAFAWTKETLFGGLYQKVVATRKI